MKLPALPVVALGVAALGAVAVAWFIWRSGGLAQAGASVGAGAVNAAGGLVSGAVGAVGSTVGLPDPSQTVTDPAHARYLIDRLGWVTASQWAGAPALARASVMPTGSGRAPGATTPAGRMLAALPVAVDVQGARDPWAADDWRGADPGFLDPSLSDPYYVPSFH